MSALAAAQIDAISSPARAVTGPDNGPPTLRFAATTDGTPSPLLDQSCAFHFHFEGTEFAVAVTPGKGSFHYRIGARVGVVPFTAENPAARHDALAILRHADGRSRARFVGDRRQSIWAGTEGDADGEATLSAVMYEIVLFLQEARPYIRLFAELR